MKKTWLLPLLLVGLMAGCADEGTDGGNGGNGGNEDNAAADAILGADPEGNVFAKFNLTGITGDWDAHTSDIEDGTDLKNEFVDSMGSTTFSKAVATHLERAQLDQGPMIGGIKFNKNASLDLGFATGVTADTVVLRVRSWKTHNFQINIGSEEFPFDGNQSEFIDVVYEQDNMTGLKIETPDLGKSESGWDLKNRPTLCGIYLINK